MTFAPVLAAAALVDRDHIAGTGGVRARWDELRVPPPGDGRTFRALFGRSDETFRRLDVASRALVLACEALGLDRVLPEGDRDRTALVVATSLGCLDADRQFARSLGAEMLDAPIFPYTLPSTCVGEIALRHGLRGPGICLSVPPAEHGLAFAEAVGLLAGGEADAVVAATIDVARTDPSTCEVAVALLTLPRHDAPGWTAWQADPLAAIRHALA